MVEVEGLETVFETKRGEVSAVNGVSFSLKRGEILGLVGESGSGKTVTGFSIMGLLPPNGHIKKGKILFEGQDLTKLTQTEMRALRGNKISMVFQDPMMTLNPVLTIEEQMIEAILAHQKISKTHALEHCIKTLEKTGISEAASRIKGYPHQFSGGMRQRVAIAIALLNEPHLIIADEPTTALDVTIQSQILVEMQRLVKEQNTALIWITHDLGLVSSLADKIAVMYAGRVVESGLTRDVLTKPQHPYSYGLLASLPSRNERGQKLFQIEGNAPKLNDLPKGCAFAPRCFKREALCDSQKPVGAIACHFPLGGAL